MIKSKQQLYQILETHGVDYRSFDHAPVYTVKEADSATAHLPGRATKNLFLRPKGSERFYLFTVPAEKRVALTALSDVIGCRRFSFGSPSDLALTLGVSPGSVTPFTVVNDQHSRVEFHLDSELQGAVQAHPLENDATVVIELAELYKLFAAFKRELIPVAVPQQDAT